MGSTKTPKTKESGKSKATIINAIKTPLGFLSLIVLVIEGILGVLSTRVNGIDLTILVCGMIISLFMLILVGAYMVRNQRFIVETDQEEVSYLFDVFVSSPMAALNDEEFKASRAGVLKLATALRSEINFKTIYYAGQDFNSSNEFDSPDISAQDVLTTVSRSRYFVLIYLSKILSSCLLEVGCSLAFQRPSVYFIRNKEDLPFLMKKAEQAFPNIVKIYECKDIDDIINTLKKHKSKLFPEPSMKN